jgi:hypothetical protein
MGWIGGAATRGSGGGAADKEPSDPPHRAQSETTQSSSTGRMPLGRARPHRKRLHAQLHESPQVGAAAAAS